MALSFLRQMEVVVCAFRASDLCKTTDWDGKLH